MSEDGRLPIGSNVSPGGGEVRKRSTYVVPPAPFKLRVERPTSSVAASRLNGSSSTPHRPARPKMDVPPATQRATSIKEPVAAEEDADSRNMERMAQEDSMKQDDHKSVFKRSENRQSLTDAGPASMAGTDWPIGGDQIAVPTSSGIDETAERMNRRPEASIYHHDVNNESAAASESIQRWMDSNKSREMQQTEHRKTRPSDIFTPAPPTRFSSAGKRPAQSPTSPNPNGNSSAPMPKKNKLDTVPTRPSSPSPSSPLSSAPSDLPEASDDDEMGSGDSDDSGSGTDEGGGSGSDASGHADNASAASEWEGGGSDSNSDGDRSDSGSESGGESGEERDDDGTSDSEEEYARRPVGIRASTTPTSTHFTRSRLACAALSDTRPTSARRTRPEAAQLPLRMTTRLASTGSAGSSDERPSTAGRSASEPSPLRAAHTLKPVDRSPSWSNVRSTYQSAPGARKGGSTTRPTTQATDTSTGTLRATRAERAGPHHPADPSAEPAESEDEYRYNQPSHGLSRGENVAETSKQRRDHHTERMLSTYDIEGRPSGPSYTAGSHSHSSGFGTFGSPLLASPLLQTAQYTELERAQNARDVVIRRYDLVYGDLQDLRRKYRTLQADYEALRAMSSALGGKHRIGDSADLSRASQAHRRQNGRAAEDGNKQRAELYRLRDENKRLTGMWGKQREMLDDLKARLRDAERLNREDYGEESDRTGADSIDLQAQYDHMEKSWKQRCQDVTNLEVKLLRRDAEIEQLLARLGGDNGTPRHNNIYLNDDDHLEEDMSRHSHRQTHSTRRPESHVDPPRIVHPPELPAARGPRDKSANRARYSPGPATPERSRRTPAPYTPESQNRYPSSADTPDFPSSRGRLRERGMEEEGTPRSNRQLKPSFLTPPAELEAVYYRSERSDASQSDYGGMDRRSGVHRQPVSPNERRGHRSSEHETESGASRSEYARTAPLGSASSSMHDRLRDLQEAHAPAAPAVMSAPPNTLRFEPYGTSVPASDTGRVYDQPRSLSPAHHVDRQIATSGSRSFSQRPEATQADASARPQAAVDVRHQASLSPMPQHLYMESASEEASRYTGSQVEHDAQRSPLGFRQIVLPPLRTQIERDLSSARPAALPPMHPSHDARSPQRRKTPPPAAHRSSDLVDPRRANLARTDKGSSAMPPTPQLIAEEPYQGDQSQSNTTTTQQARANAAPNDVSPLIMQPPTFAMPTPYEAFPRPEQQFHPLQVPEGHGEQGGIAYHLRDIPGPGSYSRRTPPPEHVAYGFQSVPGPQTASPGSRSYPVFPTMPPMPSNYAPQHSYQSGGQQMWQAPFDIRPQHRQPPGQVRSFQHPVAPPPGQQAQYIQNIPHTQSNPDVHMSHNAPHHPPYMGHQQQLPPKHMPALLSPSTSLPMQGVAMPASVQFIPNAEPSPELLEAMPHWPHAHRQSAPPPSPALSTAPLSNQPSPAPKDNSDAAPGDAARFHPYNRPAASSTSSQASSSSLSSRRRNGLAARTLRGLGTGTQLTRIDETDASEEEQG